MRDAPHQTLRLRRFCPQNQGGGALEDSKFVRWNSFGNLEIFHRIFCTQRLYPRAGVRCRHRHPYVHRLQK
ncbi:hypothetical protein GIB67_022636 [Kingdonia uniflora]|uniref:Uncharacterized protein n=1 Tax=Kingdonia uniflora TaxID=39325 RepID=A0A7J7P915_9MAGN|nr:hypothetical protein GIB67_022636 [Kingdonia uniflora]